jgi:hypothetical protein
VDAQHAGSLGYVALAFHEHADEETYEHASANFALQHETQGRDFTALYQSSRRRSRRSDPLPAVIRVSVIFNVPRSSRPPR